MLRELEDRPAAPSRSIRARVDERLDIGFDERPDAHRTRLEGREDRRVGEARRAQPLRGLAECHDDRVGRGIVRLVRRDRAPRRPSRR